MWGYLNYYNSVHHPIPTRGNREHPGKFQNKSVSPPINWGSKYVSIFSSWPNWRGEEGLFWTMQEEGRHCVITPKSSWLSQEMKKSLFLKFEIILPLLCFLLDALTNKNCRTRISMINLYIDSRTCQKWRIMLSASQRSNNYLELSKENILGNIMQSHWPCFTKFLN